MTAPNPTPGSVPSTVDPSALEGAIAGAGLSALNTRTQDNVTLSKRNELQGNSTLVNFATTIFAGLQEGLALPIAILNAVGQGLGAIGEAIWETVEDAITGIGNFVGQFLNAAGKLIGDIGGAIVDAVGNTFQNVMDWLTHLFGRGSLTGTPTSDRTLEDLKDAAHNLTDKAYVAVESSETLTSFWNEPRQLPAWVGAQADDVSYPHYLINNSASTIFGSGATTTQDRLILIPVVAGQDRAYDAIKFGITAITATSLIVGLYDVDETTGAATKVVDLGNVRSQVDSTVTIQTFVLPEPKTAQKGEVYYIAILANGGTVTLSYSSTISGTQLVNYGRWPRFLASFVSTGTYTVMPSTFSDTAVSSDGTFRPFWGALGTYAPNVVPAKLKFYDSFDRANSTTLGATWAKKFGNGLRITSNKARADSTTATTINTYVSRLNWLDQRMELTFTREAYYSAAGAILMLRGDGNGKFMYMRIQQSLAGALAPMYLSARIYSATSYSQVGTNFLGGTPRSDLWEQNVGLNYGQTNHVWRFEAIGNAYYGYMNGSLVCQWTDSGSSAFPTTDRNKEVGIGGLYVPGSAFQASGVSLIDNWSAIDL